MPRLCREVRITLPPGESASGVNGYAGWPVCDAVAPRLAVRVTVSGPVDRRVGYVCSIKTIDDLVRRRGLPVLQASPGRAGSATVADLHAALGPHCPPGCTLESIELRLADQLRFTAHKEWLRMITVTEAFEFAASHRLYCNDMTPEQNHALFGKCANANGHGHNYVVEVSVRGEPDARSGRVIELGELERIVKDRVLDRFDHKHLNHDCPEFAVVNPSVESIAAVVWDLLKGRTGGAELAAVRVYETARTYAEVTSNAL